MQKGMLGSERKEKHNLVNRLVIFTIFHSFIIMLKLIIKYTLNK